MGNCCARPPVDPSDDLPKPKGKKPNPFAIDYNRSGGTGSGSRTVVLKDPTGRDIGSTYELGRELGRGEFGVTYLCTDKSNGDVFACKSISKKKLRTSVDIEDVRREVEIMRHLPSHPNIISLKATYEDDIAVHLVMELCEGGELFDRIVARGHYTERAAANVTKTIVEVVQMCHKHGVMHRDLKPENFLFANKKETAALKAIDFGLSVFFKPGERFTEIVGSPYYMAPEVLKRNYGPEVDVWSAGVILYILLCGVPPFWAETEQGVAQAIIRSVIDFKRDPWPKVSDNAKDLVKRMLDPDPTRRLKAQEVLDHPWLQNVSKAPNVHLGDTVKSRLKQFTVMNKFKKRALRVIAEHLSTEEVAGIKEVFDTMDTNKRGQITFEELKAGLHNIGQKISDAEVKILMEAVSTYLDSHFEHCHDFICLHNKLERVYSKFMAIGSKRSQQSSPNALLLQSLSTVTMDQMELLNSKVLMHFWFVYFSCSFYPFLKSGLMKPRNSDMPKINNCLIVFITTRTPVNLDFAKVVWHFSLEKKFFHRTSSTCEWDEALNKCNTRN